ncbi:ABC transporter permease [Virgibacillus ainsalahensis]
MTSSMKRIYAIFQKDLKDLSKNLYISTTLLLPIFFAVIYGRDETTSIEVHMLVINLTLAVVTSFIQCAIIAEEKEKNTLRGLMLSPATVIEILTGKSLATFLLTVLTLILCMVLTGYESGNIPLISVAIGISILFYLTLGTLLGLVTKTVVEASVVIMPILFIFGFGSILLSVTEKYPVLSFIEYLPSIQLGYIAAGAQEGSGINDHWTPLLIITSWFIGTLILTVAVYRKRELDE